MISLTPPKRSVEGLWNMTLSADDQGHLAGFQRLLDRVRDRTRSVAERYQNGCYLVGRAGSGKTYTVLETLEKLGKPYAYRNARMSGPGLFAFLEEHPEHTCVLDDLPAIFDQRQALQIVMAAMGGEPGKPRPMTYTIKSKHERKSFEFSGGIIAISNLPLRRDPLADAVASRVPLLEHEPSDEMLAAFMRYQALRGFEDMNPLECLDVVEFGIAEAKASDYRLDLRHMKKAWQDFRLHKHGKSLRPWQELVRTSMKRIVKEAPSPLRRADQQAQLREIALDLFKRFPGDRSHREEQWRSLTNKSPDVLYRHGRKLKAEGLV
jgi:hypothetical protein